MPRTLVTELHDPEARAALSEAVAALLLRWGVHPINQPRLLGLADATPLVAGAPVPDDPEVLERVGHLLAIDRNLRARYPHNPACADDWMTTAQPALDGKTPLEVVLVEGVHGMQRVRELLEPARRPSPAQETH